MKHKYDFETEDKELLKVLNNLEKIILKNFGEPCKTKAVRCLVCQIWVAFDNLKLMFY